MILLLRTFQGRKQHPNSLHHHQHHQQQQHHRSPVPSKIDSRVMGPRVMTPHQLTNIIPHEADDVSSILRLPEIKTAEVGRERRAVTEQQQQLIRPRNCRSTRSDCTDKVPGQLDSRLVDQCVGRPSCSVAVDSSWIESCNGYAQFIQVIYQCVPRKYRIHTLVGNVNSVGQGFELSLNVSLITHC